MTDTSPLANRNTGFWSAVREAIAGSRQDYTEGPIGRAVLLLAIPMVLEMFMESLFAVVDIFWVSRLGADAVAVVALTESMLALVYTVAMGLSIGVAATVARRIGEHDRERAALTAVQGIGVGIIAAAVFGVAGALLAPQLLQLMGASPSVIESGSRFTRIMLGGNGAILLLFLINAVFRGAGDAAIAMRVLWFANAINMLLGPCLIFGLGPFPEMGVTGAAAATTFGRSMGVMYQLWSLARKSERVRLTLHHLRLVPAMMIQLVRLSATGMLQVLIGTASWIALVRLLSTFGSNALAGYAISIRVVLFTLLPAWGLSNAAATMVGQGLGARKPDRAERAVWIAGGYNLVFLGTVGLLYFLFASTIISWFSTDPEIHQYATQSLRVISLGFPMYAYGMVLTQSFNGAGDTWTPTLINLACFWCWEIPLAIGLATRGGFGPMGVFVSIAVAFSTLAVVSAVVFRRGKWKSREA
ncbi:MAG TPA: MATE family efflux transporter [Gemmatimonadales bacterium]